MDCINFLQTLVYNEVHYDVIQRLHYIRCECFAKLVFLNMQIYKLRKLQLSNDFHLSYKKCAKLFLAVQKIGLLFGLFLFYKKVRYVTLYEPSYFLFKLHMVMLFSSWFRNFHSGFPALLIYMPQKIVIQRYKNALFKDNKTCFWSSVRNVKYF